MSHSYCICQRVWKWQQCCTRAQDQYVLDPVSNKWKKKNQSWNNHLSAASLHTVAGTFTLAINCHLAGVLLKLTNCRKTDWRSESINYNNLPLQWFSHPVCVWCRSTTGSECILILPMAPSGLEFKGIDHHSKGRPVVNVLEILTQWQEIPSETWTTLSLILLVITDYRFGIIMSFNLFRYNHLLPNPVELLDRQGRCSWNTLWLWPH